MNERISYADDHGNIGARPILLLDRALGAMLAFVGGAATLAIAPVILGVGSPGLLALQHPFFSWPIQVFFAWGAVWLLPAAILGWIAGFPLVLAVFSHLWFTADPPNRQLSFLLWTGIVVINMLTRLLMLS